jgi:hypothetical protein
MDFHQRVEMQRKVAGAPTHALPGRSYKRQQGVILLPSVKFDLPIPDIEFGE